MGRARLTHHYESSAQPGVMTRARSCLGAPGIRVQVNHAGGCRSPLADAQFPGVHRARGGEQSGDQLRRRGGMSGRRDAQKPERSRRCRQSAPATHDGRDDQRGHHQQPGGTLRPPDRQSPSPAAERLPARALSGHGHGDCAGQSRPGRGCRGGSYARACGREIDTQARYRLRRGPCARGRRPCSRSVPVANKSPEMYRHPRTRSAAIPRRRADSGTADALGWSPTL